jgi:2-hydroxychromene-2-carboxylate isomerase
MSGAGRAQPIFYFDFASPDAYLAAERVMHVLPEVPEWIPVRLAGLAAGGVGAFRCAEEELIYREDVEARARRYELQPLRWPDPFPADTAWAMLAATYAKQIGRGVAFSLAAFRQAFAGGRDLGERDSVLIAAAACEMHPTALIKGAELGSIAKRLEQATAEAAAAGVLDVPAVVIDGRVFHGDRELERAAAVRAA